MMAFLKKAFLLHVLLHLYVAVVMCSEVETEIFSSQNTMDGEVKIPRLMKRYYEKWTSSPQNYSNILHSIPVEVADLDETLLMTSSYRANNNPILKTHLLIEFSDPITPKELHYKKYYAELDPIVESHGKVTPKQGCSLTSSVSRSRFVNNLLEMRFNIKHLYVGCKRLDKKLFKFKFRLLGIDGQTADIDLRTRKNNVFILLKEGFTLNSANIIPAEAVEKTLEHILSRTEKIQKAPELRHFASRKRKHGKNRKLEKMQKAPQLRQFVRPWRQNERQSCRVRDLNVSFDSIGWDWIVAPTALNVYRCNGQCYFPLADHFNSTGHAVLQTIVYSVFGSPPAACCVPKDLDPLTVLYLEGKAVALRTFPNMIVRSCACL